MSNLLNAIAQSEQQHQTRSPLVSPPARKAVASRRLSSWLLPTLLVITPVAGTVAYTQLTASKMTFANANMVSPASAVTGPMTTQPEIVVKAEPDRKIPKRDVLVLSEGASEIHFLPYPELQTEPLPSLNHQLVSRATRSASFPPARRDTQPVSEAKIISAQPMEVEWGLEGLDYSELSPQLAEQLKSAIAATDSIPLDTSTESDATAVTEPVIAAVAVGELPASVQDRIPQLNFQTHIYSSTANSRWVKVNGREAYEGDEIAPGVTLRRIEPRKVVFDFESYLVEMPALSEW